MDEHHKLLANTRTSSCQPVGWRVLWAVALLAGGSGCAQMQLFSVGSTVMRATPNNPITQAVCLWQPAEGRDPEGHPCRGFAGQILFLTHRHPSPVKADGDVRIYVFDDQGADEDQSKPLRQYDFSPEAWNLHMQTTTLGPAYHVFIPYTRKGSHTAVCSLRLRLTSKVGPVIFSEVAAITLDGRKSTSTVRVNSAQPTVASGLLMDQAIMETPPARPPRRRTTTISLEPSGHALAGPGATGEPVSRDRGLVLQASPQNSHSPSAIFSGRQQRIAAIEQQLDAVLKTVHSAAHPLDETESSGAMPEFPGE